CGFTRWIRPGSSPCLRSHPVPAKIRIMRNQTVSSRKPGFSH
ncbi:MAG: hypothetical protein AVDCRST_MAG56-5, partial [uncultured Cytophagales bacterium]